MTILLDLLAHTCQKCLEPQTLVSTDAESVISSDSSGSDEISLTAKSVSDFFGLPNLSSCFTKKCKVTLGNGRCYSGQWFENMKHGEGKEWNTDGSFLYEGQFRNNEYHGFGTMKWVNGSKYTGEFKNNRKNGWGHEFYPNGDSYQGCFADGNIHGNGSYFGRNGEIVEGKWENGRLMPHKPQV